MTDDTTAASTLPEPTAARQSPAGHLAHECVRRSSAAAVTLREVAFLAQVELRVDPAEADTAARLTAEFLGCPLPEPGRACGTGRPHVLWAGPGWYLVVDETATGWGLVAGLRSALCGEYGPVCASVVDVSAQRSVMELRGPRAREVLEHGCALDLHPRAFRPGGYAQTVLAKAAVGLLQTDTTPTYRILVRASYADYLVRWLLDAMTEYVTK